MYKRQVHREDTPLSAVDFTRLQAGKVNEGRFAGRPYFVRFVKLPAEVPERYGDPRFVPAGRVLVEARVVDDRDALFTPCRYSLGELRFLEGARVADLREVVSFRGRFADQARSGQRVRACGALERVVWRERRETTRLVVGGPRSIALEPQEVVAASAAHHQARRLAPLAPDDTLQGSACAHPLAGPRLVGKAATE